MLSQVPCHQDVWVSGVTAPCTLELGTRWKWVVSSTNRSLSPWGKSRSCTRDKRFGEPQSYSRRGGKEKSPCLCRESNPCRPARSL